MAGLSIAAMLMLQVAQTPLPQGVDPVQVHRAVLAELSRVEKANEDDLVRIRAARAAALCAEKDKSAMPRSWQKTAGLRNKLHGRVLALMEKSDQRIRDAIKQLDRKGKQRFAGSGLGLVARWIELSAPQEVRRAVVERLPTLRTALRWQDDAKARREFLARVADRTCRTPSRTDLDDLTEMLAWTALFHAELALGGEQLKATTKDLVLVLTDRDASGFLRSKSTYYKPGRFLDAGFGKGLRDGSDQVRHFVWALRAMARSPNLEATRQLLDLKELRDSVTRSAPVEKADLELNRRAREITETMLGVKKGLPKGARVPRPIGDLPRLVRDILGR